MVMQVMAVKMQIETPQPMTRYIAIDIVKVSGLIRR
jgi:hypothetical protein